MSKLIVFDLDGCLAQTDTALEKAFEVLYPLAFGMSASEIMPIQEKIYYTKGCVIEYFRDQLGKDDAWVEDVYQKSAALAEPHLKEMLSVDLDLIKALQTLKDEGWTIAAITQATRKHALNILTQLQVDSFFNPTLILSREDTPGFTKRTLKPFEEVLSRLPFEPTTKIMLEDSMINLKAPRALDFKTGLIAPEPQTDADWLTYQSTSILGLINQILNDPKNT